MTRRIRITGIGAICAAGNDAADLLATFHAGLPRVSGRPPFETPIVCPTFPVAGELPVLREPYARSRSLTLAMHAVRQAMTDAALPTFDRPSRVGVCVGTTVACQLNSIPFYEGYRRQAEPSLQPVYDYFHANLAQAVSDLTGAGGPRATVVNACSSGADAIGIAAQWISAGLCDVAIAGGADELHRVPLAGFHSLGVMSEQPCRPFDRDRSGLNLGEGAGFVILEGVDHAQARGHDGSFELAGFGAACDAHHLTAPHPEARGLIVAIRQAMAQAGITPADIAFINAHGTATQDNDRVEAHAIHQVFGDVPPPFISTKGHTGHTLGAAGGLEAVFCLLGLREGWIPASAGFEQPPDDMPVAPVSQRTIVQGDYALSTSLAFGGNNSALLVRRVTP